MAGQRDGAVFRLHDVMHGLEMAPSCMLVDGGVDVAGADHVHADAIPSELDSGSFRAGELPGFGSEIRGRTGSAEHAGAIHGRGDDDGTAAQFQKGNSRFGGEESAAQIDVHRFVPLSRGEFL